MSVKLILIVLVVVGLISHSYGDDIAKRLYKRYNNLKEKCYKRKHEKPAFECSGIMIRGVDPTLKLAWNMKDLNKHKEAFSLAYLRRDQKFSRFPKDYTNGFIIYPHMFTPRKKWMYRVFCSFPLDAYTDFRHGHGCGMAHQFNNKKSDHCRKQDIRTFEKWKVHFKGIVESPTRGQCGFDLTRKSAAKYFALSLKAKRYIQDRSKYAKYAFRNNELRMHNWDETKAKRIPIEAFFFLFAWLCNWKT